MTTVPHNAAQSFEEPVTIGSTTLAWKAQANGQHYEPAARQWPASISPDALIGLAGDFVGVVAPSSEADPVALLVQFLVAFGSAAGRSPHFTAEADRHGVNLFAVVVGETSKGRKGTSMGHVRRLV